jgi:hypothetical protein
MATFRFDVFLSYNKADKAKVLRLAERLRGAGLRVWLDDWVIPAGADIYLSVERGLEESRRLVLCLSPADTSLGILLDSIFNPSCSCNATKMEGLLPTSGALPGRSTEGGLACK